MPVASGQQTGAAGLGSGTSAAGSGSKGHAGTSQPDNQRNQQVAPHGPDRSRADYGSKDSRIVGPGAPGAGAAKGASNPGGLGKGPADMPAEPATGGGLPGRANQSRAPADSAGRQDGSGLSGRPRTGSGGATIDQTTPPDTKAR